LKSNKSLHKLSISDELVDLLNEKYDLYNQTQFIDSDPISIPHQYSDPRDIEITALWTSLFAWGQRKTIINKAEALFELMDHAPYQFIVQHKAKDRARFRNFKHRTFNNVDCYCFLEFFQQLYKKHTSLEPIFAKGDDVKDGLINFRNQFDQFTKGPVRTQKHISTPLKKSACKRLNMFLRWMVRQDDRGVDFGLWKTISPSKLYIPLDVHVAKVARHYKLLERKQNDWQSVSELTNVLRQVDPSDPIKYDYALFGMGVLES